MIRTINDTPVLPGWQRRIAFVCHLAFPSRSEPCPGTSSTNTV
jgi:hypothetical protein